MRVVLLLRSSRLIDIVLICYLLLFLYHIFSCNVLYTVNVIVQIGLIKEHCIELNGNKHLYTHNTH